MTGAEKLVDTYQSVKVRSDGGMDQKAQTFGEEYINSRKLIYSKESLANNNLLSN